jgi:hypothetical protein
MGRSLHLLRETDGFESLSPIEKAIHSDDEALLNCVDVDDPGVYLNPISPAYAPVLDRESPAIRSGDQLLEFHGYRLPGIAEILEEPPQLLAAVQSAPTSTARRVETYDTGINIALWMQIHRRSRIVAAVERLIDLPNDLHDRVRHRLPSIPPCEETGGTGPLTLVEP